MEKNEEYSIEYIRMLEWLVLIGWFLALGFGQSCYELAKKQNRQDIQQVQQPTNAVLENH